MTRIAWPPEARQRIGILTPMPLDHLRPELEQALLRDLEQWSGEQPGPGKTSFIVKPGWGRVDRDLGLTAVLADRDGPWRREVEAWLRPRRSTSISPA